MTWKDIDAELLELFGEASRARGHVQRTENQAASASRSYDFGELFTGFGVRTSKKVKAAEAREFKLLYLRKWYREAKADLEKLARIHASRKKAKAVFRMKLKADATLRQAVRSYMRAWRARNADRTRTKKREWTRKNAERLNAARRAKTAEQRAAGVPPRKRGVMTPEQAERDRARKRAWEERNREDLRARRRARYVAGLEENRRMKREEARRRYAPKKKPVGWSLRSKAAAAGLGEATVRKRLKLGWSLEGALATPAKTRGNPRKAAA